MKKAILFLALLVLGMFLISACSQQKAENPVGQGTPVPQETKQTSGNAVEQASTQDGVKEFTITAKQFQFSPSTIEVNKGDRVRLIITSTDVPHGFAIAEYGINQRLEVGKPATIEFTADKEGTFTSFCSVICGAGHSGMKGKLIVH